MSEAWLMYLSWPRLLANDEILNFSNQYLTLPHSYYDHCNYPLFVGTPIIKLLNKFIF